MIFFVNLIIKSKSEIRSNFSENTLGKFSNFFFLNKAEPKEKLYSFNNLSSIFPSGKFLYVINLLGIKRFSYFTQNFV